jgi:undecaprenyl-diphosphatase
MPIVVLLTVSTAAGLAVWRATDAALRRWRFTTRPPAMAAELRSRTRIGRIVRSRTDAEALTGLALTLALVATTLAGVAVGVLALVVRQSDALAGLDSAAAQWAKANGDGTTHRVVEGITAAASTPTVIMIAVVIGATEMVRVPSRWIPVFLVLVVLGDSLVTNIVKEVVGRARPALDPAAATLGPSFPSGHSSTAAAFFAALALLMGRRRRPSQKAALAGMAAGIAVAVASSRVLLDVHWVSDVVAGLALGWGWFAFCAAAFRGWMLRSGRPVEPAESAPSAARRSRQVMRSWTPRGTSLASTRVWSGSSASRSWPDPNRKIVTSARRPLSSMMPIEFSNVGPAT